MNKSICGANCAECYMNKKCNGCTDTNGCPFGTQCFIAKYINISGVEKYQEFKQKLIDEVNALKIPGMLIVNELYALVGSYVNLEYALPNGQAVKLLDDNSIYLGCQIECEFGGDRCFGVVAGMDFIAVCTYKENGTEPELLLYKKR